eukprot:gene2413-8729_t
MRISLSRILLMNLLPSAFPTQTRSLSSAFRTHRASALNARTSCPATGSKRSVAMASLNYPKPIVMSAKEKHTASVIMLHGLGDTGEGWAGLGPDFQSVMPHVKFTFPSAPRVPRGAGGSWGSSWYYLKSNSDCWFLIMHSLRRYLKELVEAEVAVGFPSKLMGIAGFSLYLEKLVEAEVAAGIPSKRIVIAGFSQGGATALLMLRSKMQFAGIVGLSSYMPLRNKTPVISEENKATPILMCHGDADQVVAYKFGRVTQDLLHGLGADIEFITYTGMGHSASPAELEDIKDFLKEKLKNE